MANQCPIRSLPAKNMNMGGLDQAAISGFYPHRSPVGGTDLGFPALPFSVGAGASVFGSNVLVVAGYTTFQIVATTAVAMGLTVRHIHPTLGTVAFTDLVAALFAAGVSTLVPFGSGSVNLTSRCWNLIQVGFNNATGGAANVTALEGLWCGRP